MSDEKLFITVDGIVAMRDKQPYLRLFAKGEQVGQLSMAQARNIAADIVQVCARTEADAMLIKFFETQEFPHEAAIALLLAFRDFRLALDREPVERSQHNPETGETIS